MNDVFHTFDLNSSMIYLCWMLWPIFLVVYMSKKMGFNFPEYYLYIQSEKFNMQLYTGNILKIGSFFIWEFRILSSKNRILLLLFFFLLKHDWFRNWAAKADI